MLRSFVPLLVLLNYNVHCFTSVTTTPRQHHHPTTTTSLYSHHNAEIFVVSLEGVAIDMRDWRIQQGIRAALDTWPHLHDFVGQDQEWLWNKIRALSHVMTKRPGFSPTCDYAMLTRLLLEEQSLDGGRSTGKMGKYASRFHPSSCDSSKGGASSTSGGTTGSSRPLTVGEIEVNWCDGAYLSETLVTRYTIHGQNPLTILQKCIHEQSKEECDLPQVNPVICDALSECSGTVILKVGHSSDLECAQRALCNTPLQGAPVVTSIQDALSTNLSLLIHDDVSDYKIFQRILETAPEGSTAHIVESSWTTLREAKLLYGMNMPRGRVKRAAFGENQQVSLHLWEHGGRRSVSQLNHAEMDPWTLLLSETEFAEFVSARIVTRDEN